ncbi:MAG: hypothetical protein ACLS69_05460 [Butyricicoccus sp.]
MNDARRYYTNIVSKYGVQVQALLKKAASLDIEMICPPWSDLAQGSRSAAGEVPEVEHHGRSKTVMIAYATMYGNTENAANAVGMLMTGWKNIAMYDVRDRCF